MLSGYTVSVRNSAVVQVGAKAIYGKKFVGHVRMFEEVYHTLSCPQLSLLALKRPFFHLILSKPPFPVPHKINLTSQNSLKAFYTADAFLPPSYFYFHVQKNQ